MLRDGYNVQFEGTIVQTSQEPSLIRENHIQRDQGWSWVVLFAAFLTLFITNGMHASFGILYAELISHFDSGREETAWIGSISLGLLCFFCPVASVLIEQIGCRATSIIGAFLCSLGFLLSSFATGIALLYFSHGLLFGLGTSLTYSAAMTVVTRSFERRRNIATGLCTSGSQFGGISLAPLSQVLFDRLGYANTFRTFSGLLLVVAIASLVYRSEQDNTSRPTSAKKSPKEMLNVWKSKPYIVWALGTTMVTLGYNIPRYTLAKYAIDQGISKDASAWLVSYLCASSAIGRITFGRLCEWLPNLYLCQACIIGCAISAFLYPFLKSYLALVITAIIFGLPDGGFVASLSLVTMEIVGPEKMVEGFGFMLFCQSYSNVIGPPLSGMLYDTYKSYKAAFCFAAIPEIIGALLLFLVPYYRRSQVKYTHEIEGGETSTINPISEDPILPTEAGTQGEYNVVINLASDSPDLRLVNVIIQKAGRTETIEITRNDGEGSEDTNAQIEDSGTINRAVEKIQMPVCSGESSNIAFEDVNSVDKSATEGLGTTVTISNEQESNTTSSVTSAMKSSSTQTVIYDVGTHFANRSAQTVNDECTFPPVMTSTISAGSENDQQMIDIGANEVTEDVQLVAFATSSQNDEGQNFDAQNIINLELQVKTSDKSLPLEASASFNCITSNTVTLSEAHEDIIHLQIEHDVPKISPPPQHKHHMNTIKTDHVQKADASSPEAMLAELDTLVQESELATTHLAAIPFSPDVNNNQQQPLIKCTGFESGMEPGPTGIDTGLEPGLTGLDTGLGGLEPGLGHNQESLMLSATFIPEMTSSCVSTAFSTEPSHMSGINDVLTQKQLPEPLKPTSLGSVKGNEHQNCNSQEVAPATSPLSCELSTVIADVIQSLTSQQSSLQKSNKESTISSNFAENTEKNTESTDHHEKKNVIVVETPATKEPMLGLNVEPSSQASSALSSYYKLQTSVLHSMQSIVAEGCPEDVALLEDISIDLSLDKDPSFASIVLIDDVDEQNHVRNIPSSTHGLAVTQPSGISHREQGSFGDEPLIKYPSVISTHHGQYFASGSTDQPFSGLTHGQTIITSNVVPCQMSLEPTGTLIPPNESNFNVQTSMIPNQEQSFIDQRDESTNIAPSFNPMALASTVQQFPNLGSDQACNPTNAFPNMNLHQEANEPANATIITTGIVSSPLSHEPTRTKQQPGAVYEETSQELSITTKIGTFQSVVQELTPPGITPPSNAQANYISKLNMPCNVQHDTLLPASEQNSDLPHESTTVNHSDATVLQDTIGLSLFQHSAGYDDAQSHEQNAKPIEPTNPFYQDINR